MQTDKGLALTAFENGDPIHIGEGDDEVLAFVTQITGDKVRMKFVAAPHIKIDRHSVRLAKMAGVATKQVAP